MLKQHLRLDKSYSSKPKDSVVDIQHLNKHDNLVQMFVCKKESSHKNFHQNPLYPSGTETTISKVTQTHRETQPFVQTSNTLTYL